METDIRPIDDSNLMPTPQMMNSRRAPPIEEDDDRDEDESVRQTPIYLPRHPQFPQQPPQFDQKTQDFFGDIDKTTYIIIFVAFILGFFMGKTMQPVILRPG